ncbi:MAG: lysophospholipid acyltransferase family protein [Pseudomonadales bacterium]
MNQPSPEQRATPPALHNAPRQADASPEQPATGLKRLRRTPRRLVRRSLFHLLRSVAWLAALFGWRALRPLGGALGLMGAAWPGAGRRQLEADIATVLGVDATAAASILREARRINDRAVVEVLSLGIPSVDSRSLIAACVILETERLQPLVDSGRGAVLLGMHMGNGVVMAARLAQLGFPVSVLYRESHKLAPGYLGRCLAEAGVQPIHLERDKPAGGLRQALGALRQGRLLYVLMDQGAKDGGVPVRFLDKAVRMPVAVVKLARRAGAPLLAVLPEAAEPEWLFRVTPPLDLAEDADAAVHQIADHMEAHIRRFPHLWAWHHRRWRRFPVLP